MIVGRAGRAGGSERPRRAVHTAQELDPIGGITARVFVTVAVIAALVVAVVHVATTSDQIERPAFEAAALASLVASGAYYIRATSPFRAPFRLIDHLAVSTLAMVAILFETVAQWGANSSARDDWGPIALAIFTFLLGSWRPGREIFVSALLSASVVAALEMAQSDTLRPGVPPLVIGILVAAPIVAAAAAASAFSDSLVSTLLSWRATASGPTPTAASVPTPAISTTQQLHLEAEVLPFLQDIASRPAVSEDDGRRARTLARQLRTIMIDEADRSWLERILRDVDDPLGIAVLMTADERGFIRALVAHMRSSDLYNDGGMLASVDVGDGQPSFTLVVDCAPGRSPLVPLAPYIAVARGLFRAVRWDLTPARLSVSLTFDAIRTPAAQART